MREFNYRAGEYSGKKDEFGIIEQYIERYGARLTLIAYYNEGFVLNAATSSVYVGVKEGYKAKYCYFFGNVVINGCITGTVVLTNANFCNVKFMTDMPNRIETNYLDCISTINSPLVLLGNGEYRGTRRLYGVGCNRIDLEFTGFGAAVHTTYVHLNGYLFSMR